MIYKKDLQKRINKLVESNDNEISNLKKDIRLLKEYLNVEEETITRESLPREGWFSILGQVMNGSITKLVKKTKKNK